MYHDAGDTPLLSFIQTAAAFRQEFFRQARNPLNNDLNIAELIGDMFPSFAPPCHEATLALALALHNTNEGMNC